MTKPRNEKIVREQARERALASGRTRRSVTRRRGHRSGQILVRVPRLVYSSPGPQDTDLPTVGTTGIRD